MNNDEKSDYTLAQERTLLAAERTFSAWIRTALAAMAGGLGILRLITFKTPLHQLIVHVLGHILILWGCLIVIISTLDYKKIQNKLTLARNYKSSNLGFFIIAVPILIISLLLIWVVLP